jgi:glucose/arabinose dehydrogenase
VDGVGTNASFAGGITHITIDVSDNMYITQRDTHTIRKITPEGVVTTLAGSTAGFQDGTGTNAQFNTPYGVAVNSEGIVYVADQINHRIRRITPGGVVTTFAGSGTNGSTNGTGTGASFGYPYGVAVDTGGIVYVSDAFHRICKIQ